MEMLLNRDLPGPDESGTVVGSILLGRSKGTLKRFRRCMNGLRRHGSKLFCRSIPTTVYIGKGRMLVRNMSYERFGGGNRFGGGVSGPKPVETGKEYDVQITETSRRGDGIARVQGFVIFQGRQSRPECEGKDHERWNKVRHGGNCDTAGSIAPTVR